MNYISRGFKQVYLMISHKGLEKIKKILQFSIKVLKSISKNVKIWKKNMTFAFHLLSLESSRITQYFNGL